MARRGKQLSPSHLNEEELAAYVRENPEAPLYACPCGVAGKKEDELAHQRTLSCRKFHDRLFRRGLRPVGLRAAYELFYAVKPYLIPSRFSNGEVVGGFLLPAEWAPAWIYEFLCAPGLPFDLMAEIIRRKDQRAAALVIVGATAGMHSGQLYDVADQGARFDLGDVELETAFQEKWPWRAPNYAELEKKLADANMRIRSAEFLTKRSKKTGEKARRQEELETGRNPIPQKATPKPSPWAKKR